MKKTTAYAIENGKSTYCVDLSVSGFDFIGDEPENMGGKNLGPDPYDYLCAALAECSVMTVRWFAEQNNWPVENVEVTITHEKQGREDQFTKQTVITAPDGSGRRASGGRGLPWHAGLGGAARPARRPPSGHTL